MRSRVLRTPVVYDSGIQVCLLDSRKYSDFLRNSSHRVVSAARQTVALPNRYLVQHGVLPSS